MNMFQPANIKWDGIGALSGNLKYVWKITIFHGKINYKLQFSIAMLVYRRAHLLVSFHSTEVLELQTLGSANVKSDRMMRFC